MSPRKTESAKTVLIQAATDLFRRVGFLAATVDDVCAAAGVSKGAFFHHFESKEALAEACLRQWKDMVGVMVASAPYQSMSDPVERLDGCMNFFIGLFEKPESIKSCLAGTTVQEISETHPKLRDAANECFVTSNRLLHGLITEAATHGGRQVDAASLAAMWTAGVQGALLLYKASQDDHVIRSTLTHIRDYIISLVKPASC